MNINIFIKRLSKELKCNYTLEEFVVVNNQKRYALDGIIYCDNKPFIMIEGKNTNRYKESDNITRELAQIQEYLGIPWCILVIDESIYLRPLYGDFETYGDLNETIRTIENNSADSIPPLDKKDYLFEIKRIIYDNLAYVRRKDSVSQFADNLDVTDIEIKDKGIFFTDIKETDFFRSLLKPVDNNQLWRYTSNSNLFRLLKEHSQNMVSINCMNDISEIFYTDKYVDIETYSLTNSIYEANEVFIMSCCDKSMSDDLMMWRLYGQDAEGVSLCYIVDPQRIDNDFFYLANVSYAQKKFHPELDLIKKLLVWGFRGPRFRFSKWNVWKHFFKPYHFKYEKEIRLIYYEHDNKSLSQDSEWIEDNRSGIVSPMKLFCLEKGLNCSFPLALTKVLIGPKGKEANINVVQFQKMYKEANLHIPIIKPEFDLSDIDIYR